MKSVFFHQGSRNQFICDRIIRIYIINNIYLRCRVKLHGEIVNKLTINRPVLIIWFSLFLSACGIIPENQSSDEPKILTIYPDGTMQLMGRPIPPEDVVIYPDGYGGEKAAIKSGLESLHPPFYRDTIIVERVKEDDTSKK